MKAKLIISSCIAVLFCFFLSYNKNKPDLSIRIKTKSFVTSHENYYYDSCFAIRTGYLFIRGNYIKSIYGENPFSQVDSLCNEFYYFKFFKDGYIEVEGKGKEYVINFD